MVVQVSTVDAISHLSQAAQLEVVPSRPVLHHAAALVTHCAPTRRLQGCEGAGRVVAGWTKPRARRLHRHTSGRQR